MSNYLKDYEEKNGKNQYFCTTSKTWFDMRASARMGEDRMDHTEPIPCCNTCNRKVGIIRTDTGRYIHLGSTER